jgi:hypothetical protein
VKLVEFVNENTGAPIDLEEMAERIVTGFTKGAQNVPVPAMTLVASAREYLAARDSLVAAMEDVSLELG